MALGVNLHIPRMQSREIMGWVGCDCVGSGVAEWSLPTPEVHGLNRDIGKFYMEHNYSIENTN